MVAPKSLSDIAQTHAALVVSLGIVVVSVIRVFFVSGYSTPVGLAVLGVADRPTVLASTILLAGVSFGPYVFVYGPARAWLFAGNREGASLSLMFRTAFLFTPLIPFLFGVISVALPIGLVLAVLVAWLVQKLIVQRRSAQQQGGVRQTSAWIWATLSGISMVLVLQQSWMPLEVIEISSEEKPVVGYIVGAANGDVLILNAKRQPVWVDQADLGSRQLCQYPKYWLDSTGPDLVRSIAGTALPDCPKA